MYTVVMRYSWETNWTPVYGKRFAKHGHSTPWGAWVHQKYWEHTHRSANISDHAETKIMKC